MTIATRDPEIATRSNPKSGAIVGARSAKRLVGLEGLVLDISDDIGSITHGFQIGTHFEAHDDISVTSLKIGFAACPMIFGLT